MAEPVHRNYIESKSSNQRSIQIDDLVLDHLQRRLSGEVVSDAELIAEHPDLMPELAERLREIAALSPDSQQASMDRVVDRESPLDRQRLRIRCPHCRQAVEILADSDFGDIVCSSCGSRFNLTADAVGSRETSYFKKIAHFELVERIGMGSFGTVWKARDTELDRSVAIKIPRRGQLESGELEKFLREARAAAQLNHKNIVRVYEVGVEEDLVYTVSELVSGISLAEWLKERQPTLRHAAQLCAKVADALHHAHESGVIHRDLKPQNIMVDGANEPYIMDFGLAKREAGEITMTVDGQVLGTPAYMSPEQARGHAHQTDRSTDIYSLGVILYELLTGELPFRGNARMLIHQTVHDEPPSPRKLNSNIPRDLETVCLKCLEKEPHRRFKTAHSMADEIRRYLAGEPIQSRPVRAMERAWRWLRRRPAFAALLLLSSVAALALMGAAVAFYYNAHLEERNSQLEFHEYFHRIAQANSAWKNGNIVQAEQLLDGCPLDRRGFEWRFLKRLCHTDLLTLKGHRAEVNGVAYSPDGKWLASASDDKTVIIWDAQTGDADRTLQGHTDQVRGVAFSPDGTRLASASFDHTVKIWDLTNGQEVLNFTGHSAGVLAVAFSPDGRYVASSGRDSTVRLWDATTGLEVCKPLRHDHFHVNSVAFSPDGTRIVSAGYDRTVRTWDVTTGQVSYPEVGDTGFVRCVAFSPDGSRLATGGEDGMVRVGDTATGQPLLEFDGRTSAIFCVAFSPDGTRLASASLDGTVLVWDVTAMTAREPVLTRRGHGGVVQGLAFSPDGTRLASGGAEGTVKVWDVTFRQEALTLTEHTDQVRGLAFSPDGTRLVTGSNDRTVRVYDVTSGQQALCLEGHTDFVYNACFSPNGNQIASVSADKTVRVWDATTGQMIRQKSYDSERRGVTFSPDGQQLISTGFDHAVRVWDWTTDRDLPGFTGHTDLVWGVAFSPDRTRLATASQDRRVILWDPSTRQPIDTLYGHTVHYHNRFAFDSDGTRLAAAGGDRSIKVWDLTTVPAREVLTLIGHTYDAIAVVFSPDDKRLASVGWDQTVRIWDAATGHLALTLKCDTPVYNVAFSPDGNRLATSGNGIVWIWDARPWTSEAALQREALGLLRFLFAKPLSKGDVVDYLESSPTIRPQARQLALSLVDRYKQEEDPRKYHQASWETVRQPYLNEFQYRFALRQAKTACRLSPAQVEFQAALAMAQCRLGQMEEAKATLTRLREGLDGSNVTEHTKIANSLREAEALINGQSTKSRP